MEKLYSRIEAAQQLGIGLRSLDRAKAKGMISFYQETENGRILFPEAALRQYVAIHMNRAKPKNPRTTKESRR